MRYIEITIWHPLDDKCWPWIPKFEWWVSGHGFDFCWLIFSVNVNMERHDEPIPMWEDPGDESKEWARYDDGYPVADTGYEAGDAWPPNVTWSYLPPNPGTWSRTR